MSGPGRTNDDVALSDHWPPGKWRAWRKSGQWTELGVGQETKGKGEVIRPTSLTDATGFLRNRTLGVGPSGVVSGAGGLPSNVSWNRTGQ